MALLNPTSMNNMGMNQQVQWPGYGQIPLSNINLDTIGMSPTASPAVPGMAQGGNPTFNQFTIPESTWGFNIPTAQLALGTIGTLGNLYGARENLGIARDSMRTARRVANTNLENSTRSYNTSIEDRARSRGTAEGWGSDEIDEYIARNRL